MWRKFVLIFFLLFLATISIGLKITHDSAGGEHSHERDIQLLTQYMEVRGLIPSETFNLNNEGSFVAHVYRHKSCDGGWLISPMYRNSEAVSLFARQATYHDYKAGSVSYMLDGKMYQEFPDLGLWLLQKINITKHIFGLGTEGVSPVFAIRSFGVCVSRIVE